MADETKQCGIPSNRGWTCEDDWGHDGDLHSSSGDGYYARGYNDEHHRRQCERWVRATIQAERPTAGSLAVMRARLHAMCESGRISVLFLGEMLSVCDAAYVKGLLDDAPRDTHDTGLPTRGSLIETRETIDALCQRGTIGKAFTQDLLVLCDIASAVHDIHARLHGDESWSWFERMSNVIDTLTMYRDGSEWPPAARERVTELENALTEARVAADQLAEISEHLPPGDGSILERFMRMGDKLHTAKKHLATIDTLMGGEGDIVERVRRLNDLGNAVRTMMEPPADAERAQRSVSVLVGLICLPTVKGEHYVSLPCDRVMEVIAYVRALETERDEARVKAAGMSRQLGEALLALSTEQQDREKQEERVGYLEEQRARIERRCGELHSDLDTLRDKFQTSGTTVVRQSRQLLHLRALLAKVARQATHFIGSAGARETLESAINSAESSTICCPRCGSTDLGTGLETDPIVCRQCNATF